MINLPGGHEGRFASLAWAANPPRLQPDPVVLRQLDKLVETFQEEGEYLELASGYLAAMIDHFVGAFRRLDAVPRDDLFWDGTNRRPTQSKLAAACALALEVAPGDRIGLLQAVAVQTVAGHSFSPEPWETLVSVHHVEPIWAVDSAFFAEYLGSYDTAPSLVGWLGRTGSFAAVESHLAYLGALGSDHPDRMRLARESAKIWSRRVVEQHRSASLAADRH